MIPYGQIFLDLVIEVVLWVANLSYANLEGLRWYNNGRREISHNCNEKFLKNSGLIKIKTTYDS